MEQDKASEIYLKLVEYITACDTNEVLVYKVEQGDDSATVTVNLGTHGLTIGTHFANRLSISDTFRIIHPESTREQVRELMNHAVDAVMRDRVLAEDIKQYAWSSLDKLTKGDEVQEPSDERTIHERLMLSEIKDMKLNVRAFKYLLRRMPGEKQSKDMKLADDLDDLIADLECLETTLVDTE